MSAELPVALSSSSSAGTRPVPPPRNRDNVKRNAGHLSNSSSCSSLAETFSSATDSQQGDSSSSSNDSGRGSTRVFDTGSSPVTDKSRESIVGVNNESKVCLSNENQGDLIGNSAEAMKGSDHGMLSCDGTSKNGQFFVQTQYPPMYKLDCNTQNCVASSGASAATESALGISDEPCQPNASTVSNRVTVPGLSPSNFSTISNPFISRSTFNTTGFNGASNHPYNERPECDSGFFNNAASTAPNFISLLQPYAWGSNHGYINGRPSNFTQGLSPDPHKYSNSSNSSSPVIMSSPMANVKTTYVDPRASGGVSFQPVESGSQDVSGRHVAFGPRPFGSPWSSQEFTSPISFMMAKPQDKMGAYPGMLVTPPQPSFGFYRSPFPPVPYMPYPMMSGDGSMLGEDSSQQKRRMSTQVSNRSNLSSQSSQSSESSRQELEYFKALEQCQELKLDSMVHYHSEQRKRLLELQRDVEQLERKLRTVGLERNDNFPTNDDVKRLMDENRNLLEDIGQLTNEIDLVNNGQTPLGVFSADDSNAGQQSTSSPGGASHNQSQQSASSRSNTPQRSAGVVRPPRPPPPALPPHAHPAPPVSGGAAEDDPQFISVDDEPQWECRGCTFLNHPALKQCECCDYPKIS